MFYHNFGLKKVMSTLRKYETVRNNRFRLCFNKWSHFSELKDWDKILKGENTDKQIEIGVNQWI